MAINPGGSPSAGTLDVQFFQDTGNIVQPTPPIVAPKIQGSLTLTTTGSGAATLTGNTLNIPTPSAGGLGFPTVQRGAIAGGQTQTIAASSTANLVVITSCSGFGVTYNFSMPAGGFDGQRCDLVLTTPGAVGGTATFTGGATVYGTPTAVNTDVVWYLLTWDATNNRWDVASSI